MSEYWDEVTRSALVREAAETQDRARLSELAEGHIDVRVEAAKNPHTPLTTLRKLIEESDPRVALALVQNESFPQMYFEELSRQPIRVLPRILASSPRTPESILRRLSESPQREILVAIAKNPSTPPEILERLSNHRTREVFCAAQKNTNNPLYVEGEPAQRWARDVRPMRYDQLGSTPRLILQLMVESPSEVTRILAARAEISEDARLRLATDPAIQVRVALARSSNLTEEMLERLANDEAPLVRASIALNPSVPTERRQEIARALPPPRTPGQDQLFSVERELQAMFGRRTMQQKETSDIGTFMACVGAVILLISLVWTLPVGWLVVAVCLVVLGTLMRLFP